MPPPKKFEELPLGQRVQIVRNLMPYPALTVMVFLRRDLGYRIVNPVWMFGTMIFEIVASVLLHPPTGINTLFIFAIVSFSLGMFQRFKRWRELDRGVRQHSYYIGTSRFRFAWLPMFLQKNRRVERFIDPFICFIPGMVLLFYYPGIGFWLAMSGACLRVFEADVYEKEQHQNLDIVDGLIVSEIQGQVVEKFEDSPTNGKTQPASGVPTGVGDDIHEHIKRRKAKQTISQKEP